MINYSKISGKCENTFLSDTLIGLKLFIIVLREIGFHVTNMV